MKPQLKHCYDRFKEQLKNCRAHMNLLNYQRYKECVDLAQKQFEKCVKESNFFAKQ